MSLLPVIMEAASISASPRRSLWARGHHDLRVPGGRDLL